MQMGVSGPVIFNVRDGIYYEQIGIGQIAGAFNGNTIIFQSESGDSTAVKILSPVSSPNYTVGFGGGDLITFHGMTIGTSTNSNDADIIVFGSGSNGIQISNCVIDGGENNDDGYLVDNSYTNTTFNKLFLNNRFLNGAYGIHIEENGAYGIEINGNTFIDQDIRGIYAKKVHGLKLFNNTIKSSSTKPNYIGVHINDCDNNTEVISNEIYGITNNLGMYIKGAYETIPSQGMLIANNFIHIENNESGLGTYGLLITSGRYFNFINNTIRVTGNNEYSVAFRNPSATEVIYINNIFSNEAGGSACALNNIVNSNFNNFYSTSDHLIYENWPYGTSYSLNEWQALTGHDINSVSVNPLFISDTSYQVSSIELNNSGTPSVLVPTDIAGINRDPNNPDIGAVEFSPFNLDAALLNFKELTFPFSTGIQHREIILKNNGINDLTSTDIEWSINGITKPSIPWIGSLSSGDTTTVFLDSVNFLPNVQYDFQAYTTNVNGVIDENLFNDTIINTTLISGLAYDAALIDFKGLEYPYPVGNQPIEVILTNNGTYNLTEVDIEWNINGEAKQPVNWTGDLVIGDSTVVTLDTTTFLPNIEYNILAATANPNGFLDEDQLNDTITLEGIYTGLSGIYTIGGIDPDFSDFSSATLAMETLGIVGAVTFNVRKWDL